MTVDELISQVIEREGGSTFTNNPADRGGPTRFGITAATLGVYQKLGRAATAAEVQALQEPDARAIYRYRFLEQPGFSALGSEIVRAILFDSAVQHGARRAVQFLQRAIGAKDDGKLGPVTLTAARAWDSRRLAVRILAQRARFYGDIVTHNLTDADRDGIPDNAEFDAGWMNRLAALMEEAA